MAPYPTRDTKGNLTGFGVDYRTKTKRFRAKFDTLEEAKGYDAYVRATGVEPPWTKGEAPTGPTFADAASACKAHGGPKGKWKRGRDHSVIQRLDYVVARYGHLPLADFTTETFDALAESLEDRPNRAKDGKMSGDTINRYLTAASAVLTYAGQRPKVYGALPRPYVPYRPKGDAKLQWFTEEQEMAVCRVITEAGYPAIALCVRVLAATGLRVGELLALEPSDVEDEWLRLWKTKTDRPRSVPIPTDLARELRVLICSGTCPKYQMIYLKLADAVGKCGYSDELSVHSLRHTTATRLIRQLVPIEVVQKWLGHSNVQTTMRYAHVMDDTLAEAAKKLLPTSWANSEHDENILKVQAFPLARQKTV